jgi:hypothetical protein
MIVTVAPSHWRYFVPAAIGALYWYSHHARKTYGYHQAVEYVCALTPEVLSLRPDSLAAAY